MYPQFRCRECSLVRCEAEDEVCEECQTNSTVIIAAEAGFVEAMNRAEEVKALLKMAFIWDETVDGQSYWYGVSSRLERLANGLDWIRPEEAFCSGPAPPIQAIRMSTTLIKVAELADKLHRAFIWSATNNGPLWNEVYRKLVELSQDRGWKALPP